MEERNKCVDKNERLCGCLWWTTTNSSPNRCLACFDPKGLTRSSSNLRRPALEFIRGNCPDIALIDLHLPDLSGLELSRELRQTHGDGLPIIIFSGDSSLETLKALSGVGATFFMAKPVNAPHLMECIKQWTGPAKVPPT